jgi:hypothetical protein
MSTASQEPVPISSPPITGLRLGKICLGLLHTTWPAKWCLWRWWMQCNFPSCLCMPIVNMAVSSGWSYRSTRQESIRFRRPQAMHFSSST